MSKETTLQLRLSGKQKQILSEAAKLKSRTLSSFVLENACSAAEEILGEQTHFVLNAEQWEAFCQELDRPARVLPELVALLNTADV